MERVNTCIRLECGMRAVGGMICNMGKGRRIGLMAVDMSAIILMGRRVAKAFMNGMMALCIKASERLIRFKVMGYIVPGMEGSIMANEKRILCMAREFMSGLMELNMRDSLLAIKGRDMEFSIGLMGKGMKGSG